MDRIEANSEWEPNTGCRLWTGALIRDHGTIKHKGAPVYVHRAAWAHAQGLDAVPKGIWVLHKCGISCCSNPDHLYVGSRQDNADDRRRHGGYQNGFQGSDPKRIFDAGIRRASRPRREGVPNVADLRHLLAYDKITGVFRWLQREGEENRGWNLRWAGKETGTKPLGNGYCYIMLGGKPRLAHRLAWYLVTGEWPDAQIDHVNRNRTDNSWANLRQATNQQNQLNTGIRSTNKSGVTGVSWNKKRERWYATITVDGRMRGLGYHRQLDDAAAARRAAELRYRGAA